MAADDDTKPRVFLSYTRDPRSDVTRERLKEALVEAGLEPWQGVPPALEAGPARDAFVADAHAAVAILSERALSTDWMRAELELLRDRAQRDPRFVLVALASDEEQVRAMTDLGLPSWSIMFQDGDTGRQIEAAMLLLRPLPDRVAAASTGGGTVLRAGEHVGAIHAVAIAMRDGRACAVTGDVVGTLRVIDLELDELRAEFQGLHSGFVSAITTGMLAGAPVAVSSGYDGRVRVVDLLDLEALADQPIPGGGIADLALLEGAAEGPLAVAGCSDGSVQAWNLTRGATPELGRELGHEGAVLAVTATVANSRAIAVSGGEDRRLRLWDLATLTPLDEPLRGHTGAVQALASTKLDRRSIAVSGGADGTLRIWDLADGQRVGEPLQAHEGGVVEIAAATFEGVPIAVSAGADGALRVWNLRARMLVGELRGHVGSVRAVALGVVAGHPVIISGGNDGTLRIWDLPGVDPAARAMPDENADDDRVEWVSDARADIDLLQRKPLAHTLATRLRRLRVDDPGRSFLIHIDGRWGSGKSTLLDLLRKDLASEWLIVDFDAWRQMRVGPPWWALLASLRLAVRRDLGLGAATSLRAAETWQRVRRGGALYVVTVAALLAVVLAVALLLGAGLDLGAADKVVGSILAVTAGIGALYAATSAVGRFLLWDSAAGARVFEQSHRDPMESVADHFAWLIARAGRPVVFFVDDLDRCANEYVVDLLDSVQTLIRDAPGRIDDERRGERACYVVVAADGRWIRTSYEHAHAEFANAVEEPGRPLGYLFLDKIFQLTVPVPSISPQRQAAYLQALLRIKHNGDGSGERKLEDAVDAVKQQVKASTSEAEALKAFDGASLDVRAEVVEAVVGKLAEPQIEQGTQHRLERFAGLLETNPRAMKLVLNAYGIARALQVIEDNVVPGDALALWTILRVRWPALADHLRANPEAIDALVGGGAPIGAPPELVRLFTSPDVRRIVACPDGGPLSAAMIRACCGLAEDAPATA